MDFPDAPFGAEEADLADRWLPTPESLAHARALLAADPAADVAMIPMIQPGKVHGWWTIGQEVRTVPGVIFLAADRDEPRGSILGYSHARRLCELVAQEVLVQMWEQRRDADPSRLHCPGTTAYACYSRDTGNAAVFEGI
jgi:hypothetical protein